MITGRLQEKKGRYYMVLNLRGDDGKWKPKWISTGLPAVKGNKRKADAALRDEILKYEHAEQEQMEQSRTAGHETEQILFCDYLARWLKKMRPQIEDSTFSSYKSTIEVKVVPHFEPLGLYLHEVAPKHINTYYEHLQIDQGLSANTVKHHHANIRKALQDAFIDELIVSNPADKVQLPKIRPFIGSFYSKEEMQELFRVVDGKSFEISVILAAYYGLRAGEVCGLRWNAINYDNCTITINHVIARGIDDNGKEYVQKKNRTKNKSSYRTLPLVPFVAEKLLAKKEQIEGWRAKFGNSYNTEHVDYVCTGKLGALLTPRNLSRYFREMLEDNGLRRIRFHDLRHSCASLLLANGVGLKDIQAWLGHSTYSTTAMYAHLDSHTKDRSAAVITNVLAFDEKAKRKKGA